MAICIYAGLGRKLEGFSTLLHEDHLSVPFRTYCWNKMPHKELLHYRHHFICTPLGESEQAALCHSSPNRWGLS
jgi:hypothetical protein